MATVTSIAPRIVLQREVKAGRMTPAMMRRMLDGTFARETPLEDIIIDLTFIKDLTKMSLEGRYPFSENMARLYDWVSCADHMSQYWPGLSSLVTPFILITNVEASCRNALSFCEAFSLRPAEIMVSIWILMMTSDLPNFLVLPGVLAPLDDNWHVACLERSPTSMLFAQSIDMVWPAGTGFLLYRLPREDA